MKKQNKIAELGESGLIEHIRRTFEAHDAGLRIGIGDDAALLRYEREDILVTTDSLVEGIHFRREIISPESLGYRALAVNLSDIAAMGGEPRHFFLSLSIPADTEIAFLKRLLKGLRRCSVKFGVVLAGGNVTGSTYMLNITITLIGTVIEKKVVRRSGASPGDQIILAGSVGDASAGLFVLTKMPEWTKRFPNLVKRYCEPEPLVELGIRLAGERLVSSMIDVSDGLLQDLNHLTEASGLGYEVDSEKIQVSPELARLSKSVDIDALDFVLTGGDDYALLFTCKKDNVVKIFDILRQMELEGVVIGTIRKDGKRVIRASEKAIPVSKLPRGFKHF